MEQVEVKYNGEDEDQIENLLSEKLMQGYVLLEKSCPSCATPLVKKGLDGNDDDASATNKAVDTPLLVPSMSFDQPFRPVAGVPFCVACQSHVVTEEAEISILERCDSLKHRGSILVALRGDSFTDADADADDATQSHHYQDEEQQEQVQERSMPSDKQDPSSNAYYPSLEEKEQSMVKHEEQDSHDEKKEDEPASISQDHENDPDDIMAEYSVR
jgi:hypothetical protein